MDDEDKYLLKFKGYNFERSLVDIDFLENLDNFEFGDVFLNIHIFHDRKNW